MSFWIVDISRRSIHVHTCCTYGNNGRKMDGVRFEEDTVIPVGAKQQIFLKRVWFGSLE